VALQRVERVPGVADALALLRVGVITDEPL
jgi:hypothetical protein